jgi:hypothetical protein
MGDKSFKDDKSQIEILLSVPSEIGKDLKEIALYTGVTIEHLAYSYIVEGIAGDARIVKRAEFKKHAHKALSGEDFRSKSSREIINDFNLVY